MLMLRKMRWRLMRLEMMRSRRRKMMMLRRRTDPESGTHTLCEPAQSKCTWTFRKGHVIRKLTWENARDQSEPRTQTHTFCEPAQSKCTSTFHKSHFVQEFRRKMLGAEWPQNADTHFVRACAIHFHARQHFTRAAFVREFTGTMPGPRVSPECRHTLCASLRSGNALGDFTRATLYGTLQVKGHGPAGAPWSSTGLYHYRKNPSVWTRCLGNHKADKQSKQSRIFRIKPLPALERNRLRAVPPFWIAWWQKASGNRNSSQKMDRTVTVSWHVMTCYDMLWHVMTVWIIVTWSLLHLLKH